MILFNERLKRMMSVRELEGGEEEFMESLWSGVADT